VADRILEVQDLAVSFRTDEGTVQAVDGVSFGLEAGEVLAIVGESGCGKSVTAMTILGLTRSPNAQFEGAIRYQGQELVTAGDEELQKVRGAEIAMIFQDPMTSLNPVMKIGDQIIEQIQEHEGIPDAEARERVVDLLDRVGIPRARDRVDSYPFEFSGGMRQRVMIAMALSCNPNVLIADEPTTALDVTIQAQILERIRELRDETGAAVVLVHRGDVCGPRGRGGDARRHLLRAAAPLHLGPARLYRARGQAARRPPARNRRSAAVARRSPGGLPLPAALPARVLRVLEGPAARGAAAGGARPPRPLLAQRRGEAGPARDRPR
jgi:ABC-type dipeptide/oligopeptide/nickel transport system ATPase subunit